ncbi:MAG: RES family NAD+ phosphorylase [Planctomycetota bacterium]
MSSIIWTRCAGPSRVAPLAARAFRMVEAQHRVSTIKLVDTLAEQEVLETLLEASKPPVPPDRSFQRLHYLLATPFRYPPLRHGSRFGRRRERGIWYGSEHERTVMAEVAYWRFRFLDDTAADLGTVETEHSLFHVPVRTELGVDLAVEPFLAERARIASPTSYRWSQPLGTAMREHGVQAFRAPSARDLEGGNNLGVFDPAAFARKTPGPRVPQIWKCLASRRDVVFHRIDLLGRKRYWFDRAITGGREPLGDRAPVEAPETGS